MSYADTTHLRNIFEEMMTYIQPLYDTVNEEKPFFMYGRNQEIVDILSQKDNSPVWKLRKFPLIILYHSQPENHGESYQIDYTVSPLVSIVTQSKRNYTTGQRYTNSVEDVLYPIKDLLLQEMADNPAFYQSDPDEIEHTIVVWDGNPEVAAGQKYNDYLDGINIQFNNLQVFKTTTC